MPAVSSLAQKTHKPHHQITLDSSTNQISSACGRAVIALATTLATGSCWIASDSGHMMSQGQLADVSCLLSAMTLVCFTNFPQTCSIGVARAASSVLQVSMSTHPPAIS
jgi:hypothetical protein